MKKKPGASNQFICDTGETVTFKFTESTPPFLVTREFQAPTPPGNPNIVNKTLTFMTTHNILVMITYIFVTAGSSYDVEISGSNGGVFNFTYSEPSAIDHKINQPYRFLI